MKISKYVEFFVGLFVLLGAISLLFLTFKVGQWSGGMSANFYTIKADFDNIGSLKVRAPVKIAGVKIGEVSEILLNPKTFRAEVMMIVNSQQDKIPKDSSARILTEGLLGSNYISLTPGFGEDEEYLKQGEIIQDTYSAIVLENLIAKFLFNSNS